MNRIVGSKEGASLIVLGILVAGFFVSMARDASRAGALDAQRSTLDTSPLTSGWGVDSIVSAVVPLAELPKFIDRLGDGHLRYLRERGHPAVDDAEAWTKGVFASYRKLQAAGYDVVGWAGTPGLTANHPWNSLPEDLLAVYRSAEELGLRTADLVRVWEMPNEPDILYWDLPDQLVAYQKALYLGLKDGGSRAEGRDQRAEIGIEPGVLMGALGLFPGPWLERAAENGLFDYTDGLNLHFYGHAWDLPGVIESQRAVAARWVEDRKLPVWLTEVGLNAQPYGEVEDAHGRELQRAFTLETAKTAIAEGVAVFMPFVFVWPDDSWWALVRANGEPYPAWTEYARLTREAELPRQPALAPPESVSRLVLQWRPDFKTCIPQKVSATYWFRENGGVAEPMEGDLVVYNLAGHTVVGEVVQWRGTDSGERWRRTVEVPPFSAVSLPVEFAGADQGYSREKVRWGFVPRGGEHPESWCVIGIETQPSADRLPNAVGVRGTRPESEVEGGTSGDFEWIWAPEPFDVSSSGGPWIGINGVQVRTNSEATAGDLAAGAGFSVDEAQTSPTRPTMAVTKVEGLPTVENGFVRLRFPRGFRGWLRVDLIDEVGQRFTVAQGLGRNPHLENADTIWLGYKDFHIYSFGRITGDPVFRPEAIREIQLRFYGQPGDDPVRVKLDVVSDE